MIGGIWADLIAHYPELLRGLLVSIQVTALSLGLGLPSALILSVMALSPFRAVRILSVGLVELGRAIPLLVVLQFAYYGLPSAGLSLSSMAAAVAAISWMTAVYTSEIMRGGLQSVSQDQHEAAQAMGLSRNDTLRFIVIPQGLRVSLPPVVGFSIIVFQSTSLCFTIALPELMARAYGIGSATFRFLDIFVLVALMYGLIVIPFARLTSRLERRMTERVA